MFADPLWDLLGLKPPGVLPGGPYPPFPPLDGVVPRLLPCGPRPGVPLPGVRLKGGPEGAPE